MGHRAANGMGWRARVCYPAAHRVSRNQRSMPVIPYRQPCVMQKPINPLCQRDGQDSVPSCLYFHAIRDWLEGGNFIGAYRINREVLISSRGVFTLAASSQREMCPPRVISPTKDVVNSRKRALSSRRNGFINGVIDSPGRGDS